MERAARAGQEPCAPRLRTRPRRRPAPRAFADTAVDCEEGHVNVSTRRRLGAQFAARKHSKCSSPAAKTDPRNRALRTHPTSLGAAGGGGAGVMSAAPSSAGLGWARAARFVPLTCGVLSERSARRARSESRRTSPRRAAQESRPEGPTAAAITPTPPPPAATRRDPPQLAPRRPAPLQDEVLPGRARIEAAIREVLTR